jgi:hypothetical protein
MGVADCLALYARLQPEVQAVADLTSGSLNGSWHSRVSAGEHDGT